MPPPHPRLRAVVGQRVVVRLRDGEHARDVLGILRLYDHDRVRIERADGGTEEFHPALIVTGKPIPPRASVRQRVPAPEVARRLALSWRAPEEQRLGDWWLRAAGGFSSRANSALVLTDPGCEPAAASTRIVDFYAARGLPARLQIDTDNRWLGPLGDLGWHPEDQPEVEVLLASVAQFARRHRPAEAAIRLAEQPDEQWLAAFPRERRFGEMARRVLLSGEPVFASGAGSTSEAWARGSLAEEWLTVTNLLVTPAARRRARAQEIVGAVVGWAAERGASTVAVQVSAENRAALALYDALGFRRHHRYRYLVRG